MIYIMMTLNSELNLIPDFKVIENFSYFFSYLKIFLKKKLHKLAAKP